LTSQQGWDIGFDLEISCAAGSCYDWNGEKMSAKPTENPLSIGNERREA